MKIHRFGMCESLYDMPLFVQVVLTGLCNFDCSYCIGHIKMSRGGYQYSTFQQLQTAINHLAELNRPYYMFNISGGECTLHPHFFDFIEYAHKVLGKRCSFHISSNGSQSVKFYSKLADLATQRNLDLSLMISIHSEFTSLAHILAIVKEISKKVGISFQLMFNPERRAFVQQACDMMLELRAEYPFNMEVMTLLVPPAMEKKDPRYTDEDDLWRLQANDRFNEAAKASPFKCTYEYLPLGVPFIFGEHEGKYIAGTDYSPEEFSALGLFDFSNMFCLHGSHAINIFQNGDCTGLACGVGSSIPNTSNHNIFRENPYKDENFILAVKCPFKRCPCDMNWWTPKFRNVKEAVRFVEIVRRKQARLLQGCPV